LRFSRRWLWRMPSSGVWRLVDVVYWTDVSEDRIAFIFRVEKSASEEPAWAGSCSTAPHPRRRHSSQLRSCSCGAPCLTRGRVSLLYVLLAFASAVFLGSECLGTRDHILQSHIWDFPFRFLLRLAGSRWKHSTPPPRVSPSGFPTKPIWISLFPILATCLPHLILLDLFILILFVEEYKLWFSSLCNYSILLVKKTNCLSSLFSNTVRLLYSLNIIHQAKHPYKTAGKIVFSVFEIFALDRRREDKSCWTER
jgi:hypothetical protein